MRAREVGECVRSCMCMKEGVTGRQIAGRPET